MSTRCVVTFIDEYDRYSVFRHHDGYPQGEHGVLASIPQALKFAWELPRFEADDFAAAYIAAMKKDGGGIRCTTGPDAHCDLEYRYEVRCVKGKLDIKTFRM